MYVCIYIYKYVNINESSINNDTHIRRPCRGVPEASQEGQLEEELVFVIEGWDRRRRLGSVCAVKKQQVSRSKRVI